MDTATTGGKFSQVCLLLTLLCKAPLALTFENFHQQYATATKEESEVIDMQDFIERKLGLALQGACEDGAEGVGTAATRLGDICVDVVSSDGDGGKDLEVQQRALKLWREQGVVVFPALLNATLVEALRAHVRSAVDDPTAIDRTSNIRNPSQRTLRALGVAQSSGALETIARLLSPMLAEALQDSKLLVLEHAAYRIAPVKILKRQFYVDFCVEKMLGH